MRRIVLWAEALSCQLEYKYLAHLTGRKEYFERVRRLLITLAKYLTHCIGRAHHGRHD